MHYLSVWIRWLSICTTGYIISVMYCIIESLLNFVSTARNVLISVDVCILVVFTKQVSTVHTTLQNQGHCTKILLQLY